MSARIISNQAISAQDIPDHKPLAISFRLLLGLYAIIPLCLWLQLFDSWFWQRVLQQSLPSSPTQFLLFQRNNKNVPMSPEFAFRKFITLAKQVF